MVNGFRLKLKIFLFFILVFVLYNLKSTFLMCNKLGFNFNLFGTLILIGYIISIIGYVMNKYWGNIIGIIVFSSNLLYFYYWLINNFISHNLSASAILLNITVNFQGIFLTTFVNGVYVLYIISTRNYFKEPIPTETKFHKVMFVFLIFAFMGSSLIMYQTEQQNIIFCPSDYTFSGTDRFATPENTLITDLEAYYNSDMDVFIETGYYSDNFQRKLGLAGIEFSNFIEQQRELANSSNFLDVIDRVEITKKDIINENEVYLEYIIYFKEINKLKVNLPKNDFVYMIKVDGVWKINLEPEFEDQFKQMGIS
ncbi:MAG: hypothetical protein ABIH82_03155 [Candidatus Woesearchaeota archaeon]